MTPTRYSLLAAAALGLAVAAPAVAQDAPAPETPATEAPATDAPAAETPATEAPAAEAPAAENPVTEAPAAETPPAPDASAPPAPDAGAATAPETGTPAPAAPQEPEITVTDHGEWEVGCLAGTTNCEMQQVATDAQENPVLLVRLVKLPEGNEAPALAIFNTPLGTLLPPGLGFQIDSSPAASLPFEWCVQEGCIVRLGLRQPEVDALKRGNGVKLTVTSIADPEAPVELTLSLSGFTAAYDSLTTPPAAAAPAAPDAPAAAD